MTETLRPRWIHAISDVPKKDWDALAVPLDTPLLEWDWLDLMETSGAISAATGWQPRHLTLWSESRLVAAAPLYIKTHSEGEFVFDRMWAEVAGYLSVSYYPKMVGMSPVTPVSGYRFLIDPNRDEGAIVRLMMAEIDRYCQDHGLSGLHLLFVDPAWRVAWDCGGSTIWVHQGFVWRNTGFRDFDAYLSVFNANQRRNIRRERKRLGADGIIVRPVSGDGISEADMNRMYAFYVHTNQQYGPWACLYLNHRFFQGLYHRYRHRIILMIAGSGNAGAEPAGMSMLIRKGDRLFGRYWGGSGEIPFLHFEVCYYSPIAYCIQNDVRFFDPGMGGFHKVRRGFTSVPTFSLHRIVDPRMRAAMAHFIDDINQNEMRRIDRLNAGLPIASTGSDT